jgi:hypothetical protein
MQHGSTNSVAVRGVPALSKMCQLSTRASSGQVVLLNGPTTFPLAAGIHRRVIVHSPPGLVLAVGPSCLLGPVGGQGGAHRQLRHLPDEGVLVRADGQVLRHLLHLRSQEAPGTQALRHSGTQALRHSGTQALRHSGTQALRHSGT